MKKSIFINTFMHIFPISRKKIMFMSHWGKFYNCNPKYLSEYFVKHYPEWKIVWALDNPNNYKIEGVKIVKTGSIRYFFELNTCRVFITNVRMFLHFKKRKGQMYIQTWHGILPIKMIEKDAEETLLPSYINKAKYDSSQMDYLLSGCKKISDIFRNCFWYNGPIIELGNPRQDILFANNNLLKSKLKKSLHIGEDEHVLLYAPTFRKDKSLDCYHLDFSELISILENKFGGRWKVLLRLHPNISHLSKILTEEVTDVIDVSLYDDIQELFVITDVVLSDYSSLVFDFSVTRRPCFLYTPDLHDYIKHDRHFYFDISELPFPVAESQKKLHDLISSFSEEQYQIKINRFMQSIGSYDDGKSCEKVTNFILSELGT